MGTTFFGISWYLWGGLCLVIALIYTALWPRPRKGTQRPFWRHVVLRWFHALVWLLLALACFARPLLPTGALWLSNMLAVLALLAYVTFIGVLIKDLSYQRPKQS